MKYKSYSFNALTFEFNSLGPRGLIRKHVRYSQLQNDPNIYNLGLADIDNLGRVDDRVVSDNKDTEKILATVIETVDGFFKIHPQKWIAFRANTKARARLYRMTISRHLSELLDKFVLYGLIDGSWQPFVKNINYTDFIVGLKKF